MNSRAASSWSSPKTLAALVEVNELCIEVLCAVAATASGPCVSPVDQLRGVFGSLDARARQRAAQCPFLLVDVEFRNAYWWQRARNQPPPGRVSEALPALPRKQGAQLMRTALMLAWHTARFEREAASLVIGMSPQVAEIVAAHTLREIDQLSQTHAHSIRPRWADRILTWRTLLMAARDADTASIKDFRVYALQLAGAEALRHSI